jgi:hypothetical protein
LPDLGNRGVELAGATGAKHDRCTGAGERPGKVTAQTIGRAGDECDLAGHIKHCRHQRPASASNGLSSRPVIVSHLSAAGPFNRLASGIHSKPGDR